MHLWVISLVITLVTQFICFSLWIVRLIQILYADPVSGPYVVMIGQMFSDMLKFLIILLIFMLSYGIGVRAILEPGPASSQMLISLMFHPYFNIMGEYFLKDPLDNKGLFGSRSHGIWAVSFFVSSYIRITVYCAKRLH